MTFWRLSRLAEIFCCYPDYPYPLPVLSTDRIS